MWKLLLISLLLSITTSAQEIEEAVVGNTEKIRLTDYKWLKLSRNDSFQVLKEFRIILRLMDSGNKDSLQRCRARIGFPECLINQCMQ